jgi:Cu/Ag efflux pump CusA
MLPLVLIPGVGSEIYRGLATVIVGGMLISAIFTLVLIPSILRLPSIELLSKLRQLNPKTAQGVPADV